MLHNRFLFLLILFLFLAGPLFSQDPRPKTFDGKTRQQEEEDPMESLAAFLSPASFSMGLSPNLSGQLDGQVDMQLRWNGTWASGIKGGYYGSNFEENGTQNDTEYASKTFAKNYNANLTLAEGLWTHFTSETGGFGFGVSLETSYIGAQESTSGYKTAQGITTYFNRDRSYHQLLPALYLSFLTGKKDILRMEIAGTYMPFVFIYEEGSKLYSTYDEAIPYSLTNFCQALRGQGTFATLGLPIGNIKLSGDYLWIFGKYATRQDIINGNYLTTVQTYSDYQKYQIRAELEYQMDYLEKRLKVTPALLLGTTVLWENFDTIQGTPIQNIQIGVSLGG